MSFVILSKKALLFLGPSASIVQSLTILKHLKKSNVECSGVSGLGIRNWKEGYKCQE